MTERGSDSDKHIAREVWLLSGDVPLTSLWIWRLYKVYAIAQFCG